MVGTAGLELEPFCGRERVAAGDEREPVGEILSPGEGPLTKKRTGRSEWWALQDSNLSRFAGVSEG